MPNDTRCPDDRRYTTAHEWVLEEGDLFVIGLTWFAQDSLGDIVHWDPPQVGTIVQAGDAVGEVESTKSVSDVYCPVTGTITATNDEITGTPELINIDPYGDGWLFKIRPDTHTTEDLLDPTTYRSLTGT